MPRSRKVETREMDFSIIFSLHSSWREIRQRRCSYAWGIQRVWLRAFTGGSCFENLVIQADFGRATLVRAHAIISDANDPQFTPAHSPFPA